MALPGISPNADGRAIAERLAVLIRDYNRPDVFPTIYAADTGSATAYAMSPVPGIKAYSVGQVFAFKATNANSGTTPTLAVNGLSAGTITLPGGGALVAGDIAAGGLTWVQVSATTPVFHLLNPMISPVINTGTTTFLGVDVPCVTAGVFVNGPNTGSIGANGQVWWIVAHGSYQNSSGGNMTATIEINDGTNSLATSSASMTTGFIARLSADRVVTLSGATTFTLRSTDNVGGSVGNLKTSSLAGAANKATSITAVRLS